MEVNNTFGPVDIAISGMRAHGKSVEVIHSNVANIQTTDAGKGEPYRRLQAALKADEEGISGVSVSKILEDKGDFLRILDEGNPEADAEGYVSMPNIDLAQEMINLNMATRAYQANAAILKRYQKMVETSLELLR
jgi:flagellar basal-body rod protein FlgC